MASSTEPTSPNSVSASARPAVSSLGISTSITSPASIISTPNSPAKLNAPSVVKEFTISQISTNYSAPCPPVTFPYLNDSTPLVKATLLLKDGSAFQGMVGYSESLTDPSYRGQILVMTFPLIGNYGVPSRKEVEATLNNLPKYFESNKIHISGLVVGLYSQQYSHYLAVSSLSDWLKEEGIPAIFGVDTRALTKRIRTRGVLLGKLIFPLSASKSKKSVVVEEDAQFTWISEYDNVEWEDPNSRNLVAEVSIKKPELYKPDAATAIKGKDGKTIRIMAVDVGIKNNQIRCFVKRGVELIVVPWDYDFTAVTDYDGLFISNGPGDPTTVQITIQRLAKQQKAATKPIFGICLGHQLTALAAGGKTQKMLFGNRGHNIPCTDLTTGRCYITSQNHGFAVDVASLNQDDWEEYFVNANDGSNEGIRHKTLPYFSVQFHPESTPGPWDTEYLFDEFIAVVRACKDAGKLVSLVKKDKIILPPREKPRKVLILGSGGLSIGQAGEFDYSGSQAIKALREEGIYTILINPNIATIQTSEGLADKVYFLPVNPHFVRKVIKHEKPDGIYCTFGGQTALNVGVKLKDEFEALGVRVLGTPISTIEITEDRELFAQKMLEIGEKCAQSSSATTKEEAVAAGRQIGYPLIVRAAYALGGLGSGFAENEAQLIELCGKAFATSSQILVEKSMKGWKEIEYEVVRDVMDNCITVCNMENFDPLGIHTGDSIVVAPSQTLSDEDYMMLRRTAVNVIRHLGVIGECNIQYALNPHSKEYCIIEVNARLSRSSALASKATGYPLAFVAAKLGLGIPLTEVKNNVTKKTIACFEPSLDYVVVKIPRWDLKKFSRVSTKISSSMKSVGEVMAIGRTFEETIQKAIRSVEFNFIGFSQNDFADKIDEELMNPSDQRLFAIANAFHLGYTVDKIHTLTNIDKWFLYKLENIYELEKKISTFSSLHNIPDELFRAAKQIGFCDRQLAKFIGSSELAIRTERKDREITPFVKQIDTVAAEFPCFTNYLYTTYNAVENDIHFEDKGVMVLGSGVYRIGSSVEFDWCAVRCIRTLRERGIKTVMINYNPETVSTDYDEADRLYFESLTLETILDIYEQERANGVIISMGGQAPNNIALPLLRENVKIFGTSPEMIDNAENRYKFSRMLDKIGVDQPQWKELTSIDEAYAFCDKVDYPVLVRPSYVLSGAAMNVVYSPTDLQNYLDLAVKVSKEFPVVISKFIEEAKEIELDAVAQGGKLVMHVVTEHVENAGVHSGDATLILPPQDLDPETVKKIEIATRKIANALNVTGPLNIQFMAKNNEIKVIECNVRASRSFPFVSKVLGVDLIKMATYAMINVPFEPYPQLEDRKDYVGVKVPQFSFSRLAGADPILGVEMASTGEVACFGKDKYEAYIKALLSTGFVIPKKNILFSIGSYKEKIEFLPSVRKLHELGFTLFATAGTSDFIQQHGIPVQYLEALDDNKIPQQRLEYSLTQHLANNLIDLYINLPSKNRYRRPASYMSRGYISRRMAVDFAVPLITNIKCAKLFVEALSRWEDFDVTTNDYKTSHRTVMLPGLINVQSFFPNIAEHNSNEFSSITKAALAGGFTMLANMPLGIKESVKDKRTVLVAQANCRSKAFCDYSLALAATVNNATHLNSVVQDSTALYVNFDGVSADAQLKTISQLASHLKSWPSELPIVTKARGTELASVLFLMNLQGRSVHVTSVVSKEDIQLISMSREKGIQVTCDVCVHNLFLSTSDYAHPSLGTPEDVQALWDYIEVVDCFSVGSLPYELDRDHKDDKKDRQVSPAAGFEEALPLLLSAVSEGRLTLDDIVLRFYDNPRKIFDFPEQPDTYIEVEVDRKQTVPATGYEHANASWSPLAGKVLSGCMHRVVLRGQTVYLDGTVFGDANTGRDVTGLVRIITKNIQSHTPNRRVSILYTPQTPAVGSIAISQAITQTSIEKSDSTKSPRTRAFTDIPNHQKSPLVVPADPSINSLMRGPALSNIKDIAEGLEETEKSQLSRAIQRTLQQSLSISGSPYISGLPSSLTSAVSKSPFYNRNILSVKQFTRHELHLLFGVAQEMRTLVERQGVIQLLNGKVMCSAFYEPSTRTSSSFEAAMIRLGGSVVSINQITSSIAKGESIGDTVRTLACYGDLIVMRHPEPGAAATAAKFSPVPILNAGDGTGEHPSQAFLDTFTIREELGTVNGLTITMVGDLKHGRTVHSLVRLLSQYDVKINYVSPPSLRMPDDIVKEVQKAGIQQTEVANLADVIPTTDVLYVTRIQKERFSSLAEYEAVAGSYVINSKTLRSAKTHMIVMHPLPRVNEIDPEVDFDQRAAYFRQMKYGMYVRMALLALVCGRSG
ncbi:hypothetical protein HK096_009707 [Nowakowskiella sp. JEL0078]|nr:hypothetical protein HK096_009707 [Nowakowskiella sp. JEL0078]